MSPKHGPRRSRVILLELAEQQIEKFGTAETIAVDRAIVTISTNPEIGQPVPDNDPLREYREPGTDVRVIYYATALGTIVIVAYVEA